MKKNLAYFIVLIFFGNSFKISAQTDILTSLKKVIANYRPELDVRDKLVAYNFWTQEDQNSIDVNQALARTEGIYRSARLKGGLKGLVVVLICKDKISQERLEAIQKELGFTLVCVPMDAVITSFFNGTTNGIVDAAGNLIFKNMASAEVNQLVHSLIVR